MFQPGFLERYGKPAPASISEIVREARAEVERAASYAAEFETWLNEIICSEIKSQDALNEGLVPQLIASYSPSAKKMYVDSRLSGENINGALWATSMSEEFDPVMDCIERVNSVKLNAEDLRIYSILESERFRVKIGGIPCSAIPTVHGSNFE